MSNLSDKEIDRLSREAADLYEPDHSSLSWSRLEQKLTEQMPERPPDGFRFGRINPYVWGPAVVILAGVSFFFIKNILYSQHSTRTNPPVIQTLPSSTADNQQAGGNTIHLDSVSSSGALTVTDNRKGSLPKKTNASVDAGANSNKASASIQHTPETQYAETISSSGTGKTAAGSAKNAAQRSISTRTNKNSGKNDSGSKAIMTASLSAAGSHASNGLVEAGGDHAKVNSKGLEVSSSFSGSIDNAGNQRNKNQLSLPHVMSSGAGLGKVTGNDSLLTRLNKSNAPIPHKSLYVNRSLNFGLAFGPDYTDAGGIANNQLGNNIGLTIGYYLTSKLSVNTGIFYSNKFYWSSGHGLGPQPVNMGGPQAYGNISTFAAAPPVEYINGACNNWELPLTLRYDFAKNEKSKFFVNAGLSSYFMMKQTYIYFSHSGIRPLAWKASDNQQVNYWFSVADISMGLETNIGKGFSFQAEPFMKLPLKNMGVENLKLNSYGILLYFKYTPVLSRTKK